MIQFQAQLSNPVHPEYGSLTVPFPIPADEYDRVLDKLDVLEAGDAVRRDCRVEGMSGDCRPLKRLEGQTVNVDELDYLAKRLDSFDVYEAQQFEAAASKYGRDIESLINLTFCCQQVTVIADFSDLEEVGRRHYMTVNGGSASMAELKALDESGKSLLLALLLIENGAGVVTPYGVLYENGMKLEPVYNGHNFPGYLYDRPLLVLELTSRNAPEQGKPAVLYLPSPDSVVERTLLRAGSRDRRDFQIEDDTNWLPDAVSDALDIGREGIEDLNGMCRAIAALPDDEMEKLSAAVQLARPEWACEITEIAKNLDQFEFAPGVKTPEEYGRYMIRESGRFEYDEHLEGFYDYEKYGRQRMESENGRSTEQGYIAYKGAAPLEELLQGDPVERMDREMGGMT